MALWVWAYPTEDLLGLNLEIAPYLRIGNFRSEYLGIVQHVDAMIKWVRVNNKPFI